MQVQETVENHLKSLLIKHFDPRKADSIFTEEGEVRNVPPLPQLLAHVAGSACPPAPGIASHEKAGGCSQAGRPSF